MQYKSITLVKPENHIGIFDMDGVILESLPLWGEINRQLFKPHGVTYNARKYQQEICGLSYSKTVAHIKDNYISTLSLEEIHKQMTQLAIQHYSKAPINDYILTLAMTGYKKTILCTANIEPIVACIIKRIKLIYGFEFDDIVTSDSPLMMNCSSKYHMYTQLLSQVTDNLPSYIFDDSLDTLKQLRVLSDNHKLVYVDNGINFHDQFHEGLISLKRI